MGDDTPGNTKKIFSLLLLWVSLCWYTVSTFFWQDGWPSLYAGALGDWIWILDMFGHCDGMGDMLYICYHDVGFNPWLLIAIFDAMLVIGNYCHTGRGYRGMALVLGDCWNFKVGTWKDMWRRVMSWWQENKPKVRRKWSELWDTVIWGIRGNKDTSQMLNTRMCTVFSFSVLCTLDTMYARAVLAVSGRIGVVHDCHSSGHEVACWMGHCEMMECIHVNEYDG